MIFRKFRIFLIVKKIWRVLKGEKEDMGDKEKMGGIWEGCVPQIIFLFSSLN